MKLVLRIFILLLMTQAGIAADANKSNTDMKKVLTELENKKGKPIAELTAVEARTQPTPTDAVKSLMTEDQKKKSLEGFEKIDDRLVSGAGAEIPVRIYTPVGKTPMPVIVFYHGGGWVIGSKDVYDGSARALAKQVKAIVVSVDYRLAPENKFPIAHDDSFAAYKWVVENAKTFGGNPEKIAVAGESAGGNLAVNVSIKARDEKIKMPVHQLIIYPVASSAMNSESYETNKDAKPLNKPMMSWFMKNYLNTPEEAKDPRINLVAANLKDLPESTIITAEIDPLQSEGKELADLMKKQGVKVNFKNYNGVTHEFFGMAAVVKEAADAQKFAARELRQSF